MKGSEMCCSSRDHNLGMYVSMHWGNFQIMRAGIRRKSNVRTRKGAEMCVCQRERAKTREIKSLEIRSEIEWTITELLLHRKKRKKADIGDAELYLQSSDTNRNNKAASFAWPVNGLSGFCEFPRTKRHRLIRRFSLERGTKSCVTEVRSNYHLCGNKARTSCISLNNDWNEVFPRNLHPGEKKACVQSWWKVAIEGVFFCSQKQRLWAYVRSYCRKTLLLTSWLLECRKTELQQPNLQTFVWGTKGPVQWNCAFMLMAVHTLTYLAQMLLLPKEPLSCVTSLWTNQGPGSNCGLKYWCACVILVQFTFQIWPKKRNFLVSFSFLTLKSL